MQPVSSVQTLTFPRIPVQDRMLLSSLRVEVLRSKWELIFRDSYYPFMGHLRYAVRSLLKSPGFSFAAIICLALGVGANTAIFTVVDAVLFRPLPFKNPQSLVRVYTEFPSYGSGGGFRKFWMSMPESLDLWCLTQSWGTTGRLSPYRLICRATRSPCALPPRASPAA